MIRRTRSGPSKFVRVAAWSWIAIAVAGATVQGEAATLTNVIQVLSLTKEQAAEGLPVRLEGVVMSPDADPRGRAAFLADQTGGIYLLADQNLFTQRRRGDLLEVKGMTAPGQFSPIARVTEVRKVGTAPLPPPRPATYQELITGALDGQWVEIEGVVRRTLGPDPGSDVWRILVFVNGGVVPVRGPFPRDPLIQVDAKVRARAICLSQFNNRRQILAPILSVPAGLSVEVIQPAPSKPFDAPVRSADSLLQFSPEVPFGHRILVRGVVLHAQPGSYVWIRDSSSALRVQAQQQDGLRAGDIVDVLGFPAYGSQPPMLEDAILRKTGSFEPPAAVVLTNAAAAFDHEDDLVQLDALLTEVQPVIEGLAFNFEIGETVFKALLKLPGDQAASASWLPGSQVRVTGICSLVHDDARPMMGTWQPQAFQILLRSVNDLTVTKSSPWWNPTRVMYLLGAALAVLVLVIAVIALVGRRHLKEQALQRTMAEAEFSAILAERNRVAREIHDTLAQGLAATSVHLRLARKMAATDTASVDHHLEVAQQLVADSLQEARDSIWNARSQILENHDLAGAFDSILKQMSDGSELRTQVEVAGRARRFASVIENNLLRVGQEAITNAIKHAGARQIRVRLDFAAQELSLSVRDDGRGFDPHEPPGSNGGFGLVGMQERAAELKGTLTVDSSPGRGTEVVLRVPLMGN